MQTSLVQQAFVVQFTYNAHQQWARCPLCGHYGPWKEKVIKHLNEVHLMPGEDWTLIEATSSDVRAGLNSFWIAVRQFHPDRLKQSTPEQDKRALESMKKANALPAEVVNRVEVSINEQIRQKQQQALAKAREEQRQMDLILANKPVRFVKSKKQRQAANTPQQT